MGLPAQDQLPDFWFQALWAPLREHGYPHMAFCNTVNALYCVLYVHGYDVRGRAECGSQCVQDVTFRLLGHFDVIDQAQVVNIDGQLWIKHSPQLVLNSLNVQQSGGFMINHICESLADVFGNIIHARV